MITFPEFIRSNRYASIQRSKIINITDHTELLRNLNIQENPFISPFSNSFFNSIFVPKEKDPSYKMEKLKLKLIDEDEKFEIILKRIGNKFKSSKRFAWVLILAFLHEKENSSVLKMMLEKEIDVNQPIFGKKFMPSYFYFGNLLFLENYMKNGNFKASWLGISSSFFSLDKFRGEAHAMMSTTQYKYLYDLKKLFNSVEYSTEYEIKEICSDNRIVKFEKPIFLPDLLCLAEDYDSIMKLCKNESKNMTFSQFPYLLQSNTDLVLLLIKYNINLYQSYYGLSPLHLAAKNGNLELVIMYLELGFGANEIDLKGNTPLHYAASYGNIESYKYMTKKKYDFINRFDFETGNENLENNNKVKPRDIVIKKNEAEKMCDPEETIRKLKDARKDAMKRKRFKIITPNFMTFNDKYSQIKTKIKKMENVLLHKEKELTPIESYKIFIKMIYADKTSQKDPEYEFSDFQQFYEN